MPSRDFPRVTKATGFRVREAARLGRLTTSLVAGVVIAALATAGRGGRTRDRGPAGSYTRRSRARGSHPLTLRGECPGRVRDLASGVRGEPGTDRPAGAVLRSGRSLRVLRDPPRTDALAGAAAVTRACAVDTLKWNACSRSLTVVSRYGAGVAPPTLLTITSRRPNVSAASRARRSTWARSSRSATTTCTRRPVALIVSAVARSCSTVRAVIITSAPASASASAHAAPIPRPAPVITATEPSTRKRSRMLMVEPFRRAAGVTPSPHPYPCSAIGLSD
jgi:hypothetical protein